MPHKLLLIVTGIVLVTVLCFSVFSFISAADNKLVNGHAGGCFSIIQITDTQFLSESYPQLYNNLTRWIVTSSTARIRLW